MVRAGLLCGLFLGIEAGFLGGNLLKIAHGGWFPLVVGMAFYLVMSTWRRGRAALARSLADLAIPWEGFLEGLKSKPPTRVAGTAIYLSGNPRDVPVALLSNLRHNHVVHQRVIVVKVETATEPQFQAEFVAAMSFPHALAPSTHLSTVVTLPERTPGGSDRPGRRRRTREPS